MTFKAKHSCGTVYEICGVQQKDNGMTQFLIYHEGMANWIWWPASEFIPWKVK